MKTDFFDRIRREMALSLDGAQEMVLAVADRANRKMQTMRLHWHAANLGRQIAMVQEHVGAMTCEAIARLEPSPGLEPTSDQHNLQLLLEEHAASIRLLKKELSEVDRRIAEIDADTLSDDLLKFQKDLSARSMMVTRLTIVPGAPVVGCSPDHLSLSPSTRIVAVFRGPTLLGVQWQGGLRQGDIVVVLGSRLDVEHDRTRFIQRRRPQDHT
jgi:hypothetical protein